MHLAIHVPRVPCCFPVSRIPCLVLQIRIERNLEIPVAIHFSSFHFPVSSYISCVLIACPIFHVSYLNSSTGSGKDEEVPAAIHCLCCSSVHCGILIPYPVFRASYVLAINADSGKDGEVPVARAGGPERAEPFHLPAHVEVPPAVGDSHQEGREHQPSLQGRQEGGLSETRRRAAFSSQLFVSDRCCRGLYF